MKRGQELLYGTREAVGSASEPARPADASSASEEHGGSSQADSTSKNAIKHMKLSAEICTKEMLSADVNKTREVAELQRCLKFLFSPEGMKEGGEWCEATTKAIISFQERHKLSGTKGTADDVFWDKLAEEVKIKEKKEEQKKAKREEEQRKLEQDRLTKKQQQDRESALAESLLDVSLAEQPAKGAAASKAGAPTTTNQPPAQPKGPPATAVSGPGASA